MSKSLSDTIALYAAGLVAFALAGAVARRGLGRSHRGASIVLGVATAANAAIALGGIALGNAPAEPVPFAGYLVLSVLVLPAGWLYARSAAPGWDAATFALAAGALCVISVRLGRTWG